MHSEFYLPEDPDYTVLDSAGDSVRFAHLCLQPGDGGRWHAVSSYVDADGEPAPWHDLGTLEGPGWGANALGAALNLHAWGAFDHNCVVKHVGIGLIDHVLEGGFLQPDGLILPYRDVAAARFCLNYKHNDDWLCPGGMALNALQMLWAADALAADDARVGRLRESAGLAADWILRHVPLCGDWYVRRCTPDGRPHTERGDRGEDPLTHAGGNGLYIVWLLVELSLRGVTDYARCARTGIDTIVRRGGIYGSPEPWGDEPDSAAARAVACRLLLRAARLYADPALAEFAVKSALAGLEPFQMCEDRHGARTKGLLRSGDRCDAARLWDNAEVALAYLDAYDAVGDSGLLCSAVTILRGAAAHHAGAHGFLTEAVDWNNRCGAARHLEGAEYGAIRFTQPLAANLHHVGAAVRFLAGHLC